MDSRQGSKHDENKTRLDLIPPEAIEALGKVLTFGCKKYSANNWRQGIDYSRVYSAVQRHLQAFWGEAPDIDEESNLSHLSHALCNIAFLIAYEENKERYRTFDDRAGNHNSYYKERERVIDKIINLVQDDPGFFECGIGDNKLQKVYDTLDYAINASPRFSDQLDFPDLTKMSHPEACKHLEVGMKVKVLFKGESHARGWGNCWCNMGEAIGNEFIVETVEKYGIRFKDSGFWQGFPAFVLEIVSGPEDTE